MIDILKQPDDIRIDFVMDSCPALLSCRTQES